MSFGGAIKKLRKDAGLSQQEVAEKLGMARATYASLEVDRREPDLGELKAIAHFYEISMMDLVAEEGDDWPGVVSEPVVEYKSRKDADIIPRDIDSRVNPEKLREVLLYVLARVGAKPNVGETVLKKLLYLIDARYSEAYGRTVTGVGYLYNRYGPMPTKAFTDVVKQMEVNGELEIVATKHFNNTQKKFLPVVRTDLRSLSANELQHIDNTLALYGDKTAEELLGVLRGRHQEINDTDKGGKYR